MSIDLQPPYPWDRFQTEALAAGMTAEAAAAGRAMMRECYQHGWEQFMGPDIQTICGYADGGANMIAFGLAHPATAEKLWRFLESDDAGNNPRSRTPKALVPLVMSTFQNKAFPLDLSTLPVPLGAPSAPSKMKKRDLSL